MIKKILIFATFFAAAGMQAQIYHPIADGCVWSVSNEKYMTAGDTVLDGKIYLKTYRQVGSQPFGFNLENAEFFAAIRNDSAEKKVYAFLPTGTWVYDIINYSYTRTDTDMEVLIYDFSLKTGDTVTYYVLGESVAKNMAVRTGTANITVGWSEYSPINYQYSEGDSLVTFLDNSSRIQIFLRGLSDPAIYDVWIEGIGSVRGFNEAPQITLADYGYTILLCFDDSLGASFHTEFDLDDEPDDCFNNGFGGDVPERKEKTMKVYPNPFSDLLIISELMPDEKMIDVRIYDMKGLCVYRQSVDVSDTSMRLSVGNIPPGTYLLMIISDNKTKTSKIVKL